MSESTSMASTWWRRSGYRWTRQLHLWIGAWGAIAAILYGFTGLVMNHRFALQWPQGDSIPAEPVRIVVPESARATPDALGQWLAQAHGLKALSKRSGGPGGPLALGSGRAEQPARWSFSGGTARDSWSADYAVGDASLELKRSRHDWLAAFNRLHKSHGGGVAWILLSDSFALAMVLLGISGIVLWARGRRPRDLVLSVFGLGLLVLAAVLVPALG